ncbi:MAG: hypothetical protein PHW65_04660 [Dehalococcoidales bacterium]|nr:hypothetical protein [Dehalococcoidales bacterium]
MAHLLPPKQCSGNTPSWTDPTITDLTTEVRKPHMDELRSMLNAEFTRRGKSTGSYTDPTITALVTEVRKVHIDELRSELAQCKSGRSESGYCPEDNSGCMDFTDPTITALVTEVRGIHFREARDAVEALMTSCICETEQCQYCADCGYHYTTCSHASVACDDHKYSECHHSINHYWNCASINLPAGTAHPYKSANPPVAWDGYVPWDWCSYAPPGSIWGSCEYQGGHNHTDWNCKCNPYSW